jgi:hypothetical protein
MLFGNDGYDKKLRKDIIPYSIGMIAMFPQRPEDLSAGWFYINGDFLPLDSVPGQNLDSMPDSFKEDWNIVYSGNSISLPNVFYTDGRACFLRAAYGGRNPGSIEADAIRNIKTSDASSSCLRVVTEKMADTRPFTEKSITHKNSVTTIESSSTRNIGWFGFDASTAEGVIVADENRPLNIAVTPAIYLGVELEAAA